MKSIYIINPHPSAPTYFGLDYYSSFGFQPKSFVLDLATTTLASMAKPFFNVEICEELIHKADMDTDADVIAITGKITQWPRMKDLATIYREKGKLVVIGGPHATLSENTVRPYADILVKGEVEDIYQDVFGQIASGSFNDFYDGGKPDLNDSLPPDLTGYPNDFTLLGALQTSRGCPFNCEFCDVTSYLGHRQRHKKVSAILSEVQQLSDAGYNDIFITDDNFSANKNKSKEILESLASWNAKPDHNRIGFTVQASIDCSEDPELLTLMSKTSIDAVFLGIETPKAENLKDVGKHQNLINIPASVDRFLMHGTQVIGGLIVGFDKDTKAVFDEMLGFAQSIPVPIYTIGCLVALPTAPLYSRLFHENRLVGDFDIQFAASPGSTNIIPKNMTREELLSGMKWICSHLYHPSLFFERVISFLNKYNYDERPWFIQDNAELASAVNPKRAHFLNDALASVSILSSWGEDELKMVDMAQKRAEKYPINSIFLLSFMSSYIQIREMLRVNDLYSSELLGTDPFH